MDVGLFARSVWLCVEESNKLKVREKKDSPDFGGKHVIPTP